MPWTLPALGKLNFSGDFQVFVNGVDVSRATDSILVERNKADTHEVVVFKEGCELFSKEEGVLEGRDTVEVIIAVAETTKLACS